MGQTSALSPEALIEILSQPDWRVDYARVGQALGNERALKCVTLGDGKLCFQFGTYDYCVPVEVIQRVTPWQVIVKNTYEEERMRKLADGGGWHNVPVLKRSIWLSNKRIEEEHARCKQERARVKLEKEVAARAAAKQKARAEFAEYFNDCFDGDTFDHVEFSEEDGFCIHFRSGKKILVEARYRGFHQDNRLLNVNGWCPEEFTKV